MNSKGPGKLTIGKVSCRENALMEFASNAALAKLELIRANHASHPALKADHLSEARAKGRNARDWFNIAMKAA